MGRQRHHYIPRFYLQNWALSGGKIFEYSVGRKGEIRTRAVSPRSTGFVYDLYKVDILPEKYAYDVEKFFLAMVDSRAASVLRKIVSGGRQEISREERMVFSNLVLSLVVRNPEELNLFKSQFFRDWDKKIPEIEYKYRETLWRPGYPDSFCEYEKLMAPDYWKVAVYEVFCDLIWNEEFSRLLSSMYWGVREVAVAGKQVLTSDRPVIMTNGLMGENAHVLLPISPNKIFFCSPSKGVVQRLGDLSDRKLIREINRKIMSQALKYVYSSSKFDIDVVKKRFGKTKYEPFMRRTLGIEPGSPD